eukprot:scaffold1588_cov214-Alexandrium_tamarense.AAC.27
MLAKGSDSGSASPTLVSWSAKKMELCYQKVTDYVSPNTTASLKLKATKRIVSREATRGYQKEAIVPMPCGIDASKRFSLCKIYTQYRENTITCTTHA